MKKIPRRDKLKIYGDLLAALYDQKSSEQIIYSRIQHDTNLPFNRLKSYINDLTSLGLLTDELMPKLTAKGKQYLTEYKAVTDFMNRMGITYE